MKRSEINKIIRESISFFEKHRFALPPFSRIAPDQWRRQAGRLREVVAAGLGWDVTDFGLGEFEKTGILLVTLRNGGTKAADAMGKTYCEKIIHLRAGQTCPMHYHKSKTEDIINRGGGTLSFELYLAGKDGRSFSPERFVVFGDGIPRECAPGEVVRLVPGESLTIPPLLYHSFWAEGEGVLAGEVSTVNDDRVDNFFSKELPRFMEIEEDQKPEYLLVDEVQRLAKGEG
jgi:D-lyxose ketol-isomerase